MNGNEVKISIGLEGIYIAETKVCKIDGIAGKLWYRGYPIESLAADSSFEEVAYLLLYGSLPKKTELDSFAEQLKKERDISDNIKMIIKSLAQKSHPMDVLRTAVSALSSEDPELTDNSPEANLRKAVRLTAKMTTIVAAIGRMRAGKDYIKPDNSLGHAENFMYMLSGSKPNKEVAKFIDLMLVLHAEHGTNASTFSTMVTGSTLADLYAAITSGICALKGPLHGGADEAALKMMRTIGDPANTEKYIEDALAGKQKIMGFGHRVYKTYDPRAKILRSWFTDIGSKSSGEVKTLTETALRAEKMMIERLGASHGIWPNIDFFSGPLYIWAGVPAELFTPIFAAARVTGWSAHMLEYWPNNKIFRPLDHYTGQLDLKYININDRK